MTKFKKRVRKPKYMDGVFWDFYAQQFAEPSDPLEISVMIHDMNFENTAAGVKDLRALIKHLSKCADYLEYKRR